MAAATTQTPPNFGWGLTTKKYIVNDNCMEKIYCTAPWHSVHIAIDGDVRLCCAGKPAMFGNIKNKTIDEILNSDELIKIRQTIQQGQLDKFYCQGCIDRESVGIYSERMSHNKRNNFFDITKTTDRFEFPTALDLRWNNTCNLSCNYCSSAFSSKWASLEKSVPLVETRRHYNDVFNFIKNNDQSIVEVLLLGGEPLILPENEDLIDVLPEECAITFITNLSNPIETNKIFKKVKQRKNVSWHISFDNINERFEYVRHGANWNTLLNNIELIPAAHQVGIHAVYNLYNATRLCEFKQFAIDKNLVITWQDLGNPDCLNPFLYGAEIADLASLEIEKLFAMFNLDDNEKTFFSNALALHRSKLNNNTMILDDLKKFVFKIENIYHPDQLGRFAQLWPELASHLPA